MIKAGIVGGSGYTAGEMIRLLLHHPNVELSFVFSTSKAGEPIHSVHQDLLGDTDMNFSGELKDDIDVLFLCVGHGNAQTFLENHSIKDSTSIVDLSRDFRIIDDNTLGNRNFVYGLPELQKSKISDATNIANPGCFATCIQLALLPLANESALQHDVHIHGITGSTGAGSSLSSTSHFSWRSGNVSIYKALSHQHIGEITQQLTQLDSTFDSELNFVPVRGNFTRGIFVSAYTQTDLKLDDAIKLYNVFYEDAAFTFISKQPLNLKQVVNTNKCFLHLQKEGNKLLVSSITDNLLKGASGQAVQNMNLMFNLPEDAGLHLKPSHF